MHSPSRRKRSSWPTSPTHSTYGESPWKVSGGGQVCLITSSQRRLVDRHLAEDFVADPTTEGADRLGLGVAGGHPVGHGSLKYEHLYRLEIPDLNSYWV